MAGAGAEVSRERGKHFALSTHEHKEWRRKSPTRISSTLLLIGRRLSSCKDLGRGEGEREKEKEGRVALGIIYFHWIEDKDIEKDM